MTGREHLDAAREQRDRHERGQARVTDPPMTDHLLAWAESVEDRLKKPVASLDTGTTPTTPEVTDEPGVGAVVRDRAGVTWERRASPESHPWFADDVPGDPSHVTWEYLQHSLGPLTLVRPAAAPEAEAGEEHRKACDPWKECCTAHDRHVTPHTCATPPPSDDEAVERAAKALQSRHGHLDDGDGPCPECAADGVCQALLDDARAALIAAGWREVGAGQVVVDQADLSCAIRDLTERGIEGHALYRLRDRLAASRAALDAGSTS